jgi:hypothetical protein
MIIRELQHFVIARLLYFFHPGICGSVFTKPYTVVVKLVTDRALLSLDFLSPRTGFAHFSNLDSLSRISVATLHVLQKYCS